MDAEPITQFPLKTVVFRVLVVLSDASAPGETEPRKEERQRSGQQAFANYISQLHPRLNFLLKLLRKEMGCREPDYRFYE